MPDSDQPETDTRPRVVPDKAVNLAQLDRELGQVGLSRNEETGEIVAPTTVGQADLDAAIDVHEAATPTDPDDEFRQDVEAATSVADLKAALLGESGPGAEPRRGRPST